MHFKNRLFYFLLVMMGLLAKFAYPQDANPGMGNVIQINTNLRSFVGKPSWLLMIRDVDDNENMPYIFDFTSSNTQWMAFTQGQNYLIVSSTLQFSVYRPHDNTYRTYFIHNFCNLESQGRIQHNTGVSIWLTGDLWPNEDSYHCQVMRYPNADFTVAMPSS